MANRLFSSLLRILHSQSQATSPPGLILARNDGALFVGVYLLFIFGNGFTYGIFYPHLSQLPCMAGFMLVIALVPCWGREMQISLGWLIAIIVLPFYVSQFAERMKAAHFKAEQALGESLERNRGEVA